MVGLLLLFVIQFSVSIGVLALSQPQQKALVTDGWSVVLFSLSSPSVINHAHVLFRPQVRSRPCGQDRDPERLQLLRLVWRWLPGPYEL